MFSKHFVFVLTLLNKFTKCFYPFDFNFIFRMDTSTYNITHFQKYSKHYLEFIFTQTYFCFYVLNKTIIKVTKPVPFWSPRGPKNRQRFLRVLHWYLHLTPSECWVFQHSNPYAPRVVKQGGKS